MSYPNSLSAYKVEAEFTYEGLECAVVQTRQYGHRCGYVCVTKDFPFFDDHYDVIADKLDIHGGLTYEKYVYDREGNRIKKWLGFDCAHYTDAQFDPNAIIDEITSETTKSIIKIDRMYPSIEPEKFWSKEDVIEECKRLAEQLVQLKEAI